VEKFSDSPGAVIRCRAIALARSYAAGNEWGRKRYVKLKRSSALYKYAAQKCAIKAQGALNSPIVMALVENGMTCE